MMAGREASAQTNAHAFVDTNVFVYAQDAFNLEKRAQALELLKMLSSENRLVISTQVLQEFASVAIKKLGLRLPEINALLDELAKLPVKNVDPSIIRNAVTIHFMHKLSFFDSLIIATAAGHDCSIVYSEDMADGQTIQGVTVVNPFS